MAIEDAPACPLHPDQVRMRLRTLHSDQATPGQVLGVFVCPECGRERRFPIDTGPADGRLAWGTR